MTLIDLSWPLHPGMSRVPMAPDVEFRPVQEMAKGDTSNIIQVTMASHVGTHIDAPVHFIPGGKTIDQVPLEQFTGPAVTVSVRRGAGEAITLEDVGQADVREGDIVFVHTGWSAKFGTPEYDRHPFLAPEVANFLVQRRVKMVGIDCVNVEMPIGDRPADYTRPIHNTLLASEVLIIENLTNLERIAGRRPRVYAFPIAYRNGDGAQARVVAELP